ncbi:MAG: DUF1298 domain-containing protein [Rhodococcus sp.]|nr:DUF1298 domain-containing protein [Rhodococcus sp. (in: high G+C Gram-positive bacteria)]
MYWISEKIPNDQFLLYAFDTAEVDPDLLLEWVRERAERVSDLRLVVRDVPKTVDYPVWVLSEVGEERIVVHQLASSMWTECMGAVADILGTGVNARVSPWTLHLFPGVRAVPESRSDTALVAVLQLSHALADGKRAAAIARELFGREMPGPTVLPSRPPSSTLLCALGLVRTPFLIGRMVAASFRSYQAYRESEALTADGTIPPKIDGRELTMLNADPHGRHGIRIITLPLSDLRGGSSTVTVTVLTAISVAYSEYLQRHGVAPADRLGAEVTVALPGASKSRNHFRNVGVDLYPGEKDLRVRAERIARALDERRTRALHPSIASQGDPMSMTPAPMIRAGVRSYSPKERPDTVSGNTVLTSVNRGPSDLEYCGGPVLFTAGFPALSPVMGVTHGVYSIGDTATVSVHFGPDVMADPNEYEELLRHALDEVRIATV